MTSQQTSPAKVPAGRATRYYCASSLSVSGSHTSGEGRPKRKRCAYCGGTFYTETGLYGVFRYVPQAKASDYAAGKALHLFTRSAPAQKIADDAYAADRDSDLVVRWVYAS
jgi:hypothetical protein